jgi:hypothetical protein
VEVAQVRLIDGVSDHMAVVAQLEVAARV